MKDLKFILGFVVLNLYLRWLPTLTNGHPVFWLLIFISFFPLAHVVARWSSQAGLKKLGYGFPVNWRRLLATGLLIGSSVWVLLTAAEGATGSLRFLDWQAPQTALWIALQAVVAAALGSAANDLLTRGYVFAHWENRLPVFAVVALSTFLYIADDAWAEGWGLRNTVFSLLLGLAFAIAVVRTGSLWMNTGLHAGLNVVYFLVYGFDRGALNAGVFTSTSHNTSLSPYLGIIGAALVLALTLWRTQSRAGKHRAMGSHAPKPKA